MNTNTPCALAHRKTLRWQLASILLSPATKRYGVVQLPHCCSDSVHKARSLLKNIYRASLYTGR